MSPRWLANYVLFALPTCEAFGGFLNACVLSPGARTFRELTKPVLFAVPADEAVGAQHNVLRHPGIRSHPPIGACSPDYVHKSMRSHPVTSLNRCVFAPNRLMEHPPIGAFWPRSLLTSTNRCVSRIDPPWDSITSANRCVLISNCMVTSATRCMFT